MVTLEIQDYLLLEISHQYILNFGISLQNYIQTRPEFNPIKSTTCTISVFIAMKKTFRTILNYGIPRFGCMYIALLLVMVPTF